MATDWTQDADCVGAWLFTEGSGTSVSDASGNDNDGEFRASGQPEWSDVIPEATTSGYSVDFNKDTVDYISISDSDDFTFSTSDAMTIVAFFLPSGSGTRTIFKSDKHGSRNIFGIRVNSFSKLNGEIWDGVDYPGTYTYIDGGTSVSSISWNHAAFVRSINDDEVRIYLNGVSDATPKTDNTTGTINPTGPVFIGCNPFFQQENYIEPFDGKIDEVALFRNELDSTDINDIMDNGLKQTTSTIKRRLLMGCGV